MDRVLAAAKARADQQLAYVNDTLDDLILPAARDVLAQHGDATEACAVLTRKITEILDSTVKNQRLVAALLSAAAIRLAHHDAALADTSGTQRNQEGT
jgi:hypothetical protein